jgi:hypothetical protein
VAGGALGPVAPRKEARGREEPPARMIALVELVDPFYAAVVFAVAWLVR